MEEREITSPVSITFRIVFQVLMKGEREMKEGEAGGRD